MLRFYGATFIAVVSNVEQTRTMLLAAPEQSDTRVYRGVLQGHLDDLIRELEKLPVSGSLMAQAKRLHQHAIHAATLQVINVVVREFQENLVHELTEQLFLCVPAAQKWMFLEPEKWFGDVIASRFPDARMDMRDCARCLALAQWGASVFHGMLILEHGLRALATRVRVPFAATLDVTNWHNVIEQTEKAIKAMKQLPQAQQDAGEVEFCSRAASHLFAVKEAWRNQVSHGRGRYDETEATKVIQNVRDFMRALAQ